MSGEYTMLGAGGTLDQITAEHEYRDYWITFHFITQRLRRPPAARLSRTASYMVRTHGALFERSYQVPA